MGSLKRRVKRERGSISVEMVILTPGLLVLLLLLAAGARTVEVQGHIDGAARDGARAASLAQNYSQAYQFAKTAVDGDLGSSSYCVSVAPLNVNWPLPAPPITGEVNEAVVQVTVTCHADMSPFSILRFPTNFSGSAVAPLDPFMCRNTTC